jgi:hypothetical protein
MNYITVRNIPPSIAAALEKEKQNRGKSLNQTTIELLAEVLGVNDEGCVRNGLGALAGGWSDDDLRTFENSVESTQQIDPEVWQ